MPRKPTRANTSSQHKSNCETTYKMASASIVCENRFGPLQCKDNLFDTNELIADALAALPEREGETSTQASKSMIGDIVTAVVHALVPILTASIQASAAAGNPTNKRMKANVQNNTFQLNSIKQYTRRDNIKIVGLPEKDNEDTANEVVSIVNDAIIKNYEERSSTSLESMQSTPQTITRQDISIAHRIHTKKGGTRPIVAKFVRREVKDTVMKNRNGLKGHKKGKIFIHDDLTRMNDKLLWVLRNDEGIERAYSLNSVVWAVTKPGIIGNESKKIKIESPDDLYKAGLSEEKIASLDLYHQY